MNLAAAANGGNQPAYTQHFRFPVGPTQPAQRPLHGDLVAATFLTADRPCTGSVRPILFCEVGTTQHATANLDRALSFYQAIVRQC